MRKVLIRAAFIFAPIVAIAPAPQRAEAIPYFAHQYELSCQKCHTVVPQLNAFGESFRERGFRMPPGVEPKRVFPFSSRLNFTYTSQPDPGLPKALVDEIEVFFAGTAGPRTSYFAEQYIVDGGRHGNLRDAWVNTRLNPYGAKIPFNVQAGQFTLPLPVDPEAFRQTNAHYQIFDQTVGDNPFNFFDVKDGAQLRVGNATRGTSGSINALKGHDQQSGLPTVGIDGMLYAQHVMGGLTLSTYRYEGRRPDMDFTNHFARQGYGLSFYSGKFQIDNVLQNGWDSRVDVAGNPGQSSGGFSQLHWQFNPKIFAIARYDGTDSSVDGLARSVLALVGYRVARNTALTVENVLTHNPTKNTLNIQYTLGY